MKRIEKVLILISVIVFANYIIHLPMCVDDYVHKDSDIYSAQHMYRHSTLTKNAKGILKTDDIIETIKIPLKVNFLFAKVKIIFDIASIPVYHWQLARGNLGVSRFIGLVG